MTNDSAPTGYLPLLRDRSFHSFLWTQFLGAFNDNVYKMIVSVGAVELAADQALGARYLALSGAVFVLPFLLFAGYAGQLADRYSKSNVLKVTKSFEILGMLIGAIALKLGSIPLLLVVLFLLATQANFFSPAKYGILPEMLPPSQLTKANGLLELSTFAAIVLGSSVGSFLFAHWKNEPLRLGGVLLTIAVIGSLTSLLIKHVAAAGSTEVFHANPFAEVWLGAKVLYADAGLWWSVMGISYFWFLGGLLQMAIILLGSESLHLSETHTGLLVTALALGIGFGSIAAGWLSRDRIELGLVPIGAAMMGLCGIFLGLTHTFQGTLICLSVIGFSGGLFIVPLNAYLQERAAPEQKGRVLATNNFLNMLGVILASGLLYLLHDQLHWTPSAIMGVLGGITVLSAVGILKFAPSTLDSLTVWYRNRQQQPEGAPVE